MVVNAEFQRKEERYYRFDELFYYILKYPHKYLFRKHYY